MKRSAISAALLTLLLLTAACGGGENTEAETSSATTTASATEMGGPANDTATATHAGSPGGTALVPEVDSGTTVLVMLNDGSIAVPQQAIPPGPAVLTVENRGTEVHNLFIEGDGLDKAAGDTIATGSSATVDVQFREGTYTLYCPILDHRTRGEEVKVTIRR